MVYPKADGLIEARDSSFILGSVGTGDAHLVINGHEVEVKPNGAFLAWLPVPDSASSRYDLVAYGAADTQRLSYPVRLMPSRRVIQDSLARDTLAELKKPFPDSGHLVTLIARDTTVPDTDRSVIARPVPGGTYKWFFLPGTQVRVVARSPGGWERVRLDAALDVWVSTLDIRPYVAPPMPVKHKGRPKTPLPPTFEPDPRRVVGKVRVVPGRGWVDVVFNVGERPPFLVEENGNELDVTFYGAQASTDIIQYVGRNADSLAVPDTLVREVTWSQQTTDQARFALQLSEEPYGYLVLWSGGNFVLRIRRRPTIDPSAPLRGLSIAVDPGHPPAGSTGPTGLYEAVATLAISERLDSILTARGAHVIMTRTTADPVALGARPVTARRAAADAMISVHLNALPDGINPYSSHGTGTYFFHQHSLALARSLETGLVRSMGLRDLGVHYDNLAVVRPTWMPAVLCEGAFVIIPEQEAALRTAEFQLRYAEGVANGLENYFRSLGGSR